MPSVADRTVIEQIKEKLDIASVVREYVSLRRSGTNEFGLCPFHHEKSPSFSVNSDLGIFKCFGCGESGDVIGFLQKIEGLDFPEALKLAAEKAGVVLQNDYFPKDAALEARKKEILEINSLAAKFFNFILQKHKAGKVALDYLKNRKLEEKGITSFFLGFAPDQWSALKDFFEKKGYKSKTLVDAGLLVERNGKVYDKFRDRIIFPLFNEKGEVVGFSGRIIKKDTKAPKYLNSPETLIFNKSRFLYGLYQGKKEIRSKDFCILVEGPTDVINSNQGGITNICAPQGTSLTQMQLKLLHRYCSAIYLCFDQDDAGQLALKRALNLAWEEGFKVKVINLEGVKDADELMQKDFKKWEKAINDALNVVDYFMLKALNKYNAKTVEGKVNIVNDLSPLISLIQNEVERESYLKELSLHLDLDLRVLKTQIKTSTVRPEFAKQSLREAIKAEVEKSSMVDREEYLLSLILQAESLLYKDIKLIDVEIFSSNILVEIFEIAKKAKKSKKSVEEFVDGVKDDDVKEKLLDLIMFRIDDKTDDEEWVRKEFVLLLNLLNKALLKRNLNQMQIELTAAEKADNEKLVAKLSSQIIKYTQQLNEIK